MSKSHIVRCLKANSTKLTANNSQLNDVNESIELLSTHLNELLLQNNSIKCLPTSFNVLTKLQHLNLGNNHLQDFPHELKGLKHLRQLFLYNNHINTIDGATIETLVSLQVMNLTSNELTHLPEEFGAMRSLRVLSLQKNKLHLLPESFGRLGDLKELRLNDNNLVELPESFSKLFKLEQLHIQKNNLSNLPDGFSQLMSLKLLDIACNQLVSFPPSFYDIPGLRELHYEYNPLVKYEPIVSSQEYEVLTLKEITSRSIMIELRNRDSPLRYRVGQLPQVTELLKDAGICRICRKYFVNTWLECVEFVDLSLGPKTLVPVRVLICSYACFNSQKMQYFGLAHAS